MRAQKQTSLTRTVFYWIMFLVVFLFAFGKGNLSSVRAQAWTSTHQITYFQGNKPAAISITLDDGYRSQVTLGISQLNARGLKGTFFIVTDPDFVDSNVPWATWQSVAAQGHDVQCHTVTHPDLTLLSDDEVRWELSQSQTDVGQNLGQPCITMAYPYTYSTDTVQAIASEFYIAARGGFVDPMHPNHYLNYYQAGNDQNGSWEAINFYNVGSMRGDSLGVDGQYLTDRELNDSLDMAVLRHAWFTLFFHYINDETTLGNIIDYMQGKHDYWIDTFGNVARYMKERLNSTIQVVTDSPDEIRLQIVMDESLPISIYNVPLTLRSTVPVSWLQATVQQGSVIQDIVPVVEGSDKVIYYNALPNGGDVILIPSNPVPELTSLDPVSASAGGPSFTLTVTGTNFVNSSVVRWNNSDRVTTYVSDTQLTASIPASDIASVGETNVSVFNPSPGGGLTSQLPFTIETITVTVIPGQSKVYGDNDPVFTYISSDPAVTFTGQLSRVSGENIGTYSIDQGTLEVVGSNYTIASFVSADFTINKKAASVTPNAANKIYGNPDPTISGTLSGFLPADNVTATYSRVAGETVAGSPYTISATLSPADVLGNYHITYNTANFVINKKAASVTPNAANKIYGDPDPTISGTLSGFLPADNVTATYNRIAGETVAGSPYTISATLSPANVLGNYNITYNTANFVIAKAIVTPNITADNKIYDGTTGTTIATRNLTGVIGADIVSLSGGSAAFVGKNVGIGKSVKAIDLTLVGADAGNYQLSSTSAMTTANISPRTLTVTATGVDKDYDGMTATTVILSDDSVSGDDVTTNYTNASFLDPNIGSGKTVNVSDISITGGADVNNYMLGNTTAITTADISIADQAITITTPAPAAASDGTSFNVAATASSGLPVAITTAGTCTGSGNDTATIIITSDSGMCSVFYDQTGDTNYNQATQIQEDVTATQKPTIIVTPGQSVTGQAVAVTVTIAGVSSAPTGTVTITGADTNCTITLESGTGSCNVVFNFPGAKTITATYSGDVIYAASTNTGTHQVNPAERAKNGSFNTYSGASKAPKYWTKSTNFAPTDGKDLRVKKEGSASVRIIGAAGKTKILTQTLSLSGVKGQSFTFSYWVKGSAMPKTGSCYGQVLFYYGTSLKGTKTLKCPTGAMYSWKKVKLNFTAPAAYNKVVIKFTYSKAVGWVWFDLASLMR